MPHNTHNKVITFVGMAGAGKSSCVTYLEQRGYPSVYFGGVTVDETKRRGLDLNEDNEKMVREELRSTEGPDVMAKRISDQIDHLFAAGQHRVVADGLYSWDEYKFFKHKYGHAAVIVAVVAPRHVRHERLANRPVRPFSEADASRRDYNEIESMNKGGPIAIADHYLANTHDLEQLHQQLDELLVSIDFYES